MFYSLRWRLVAVFGFVILLTVSLSAALSIWITVSRFDVLITDEGHDLAQEIAPLLEANYAYWGSWRGLDDLFGSTIVQQTAPVDIFVSDEWVSEVEWVGVTLATLELDEESLWMQWDELGSLAAVGEEQDVAPETLVQAIIAAEQVAVDDAVAAGILTPEQAAGEMAWIAESASSFVWTNYNAQFALEVPWEEIIAETLDVSPDELYAAMDSGDSIADVSVEYGVAPQHLVNVIVTEEEEVLRESGQLTEQDIQWQLIEIEHAAWDFIDPQMMGVMGVQAVPAPVREVDWTSDGLDWLIGGVLLRDERILVADQNGWVVYDNADERTGKRLSDDLLIQGMPLWADARDEFIGTVIVAAGPGYYNAQQSAFLRSVSRALALGGSLAGVVALLIGFVFARRVTAPVIEVTAAAQRIATGDWTGRLPIRSNDELGQMSAAFNVMAERLEAQRALRNRLVDDVTHELNTPLSVIQLELEALKDRLQTPQEAAAHVEHEIELLRNLVNDLSLLAETDEGELELTLEAIDLAQFTAKAVARWRSQAEANGIELCMLPAESLPPVDVDSSRMAQVLGNLIANALQHTPPGGRVEVCCRQDHDPAYVLTTVADTGEGISDADQAHVFERFYRTDRSRSRRTGGQGLGLAIVRQIVEQHGGQVWVESLVGEGSTFGYRLPVKSD